jgi:MoxR-like ATPase
MSSLSFDPYTVAAPAKKKPRGRPFAPGHDPRRAHAAVGLGAPCPECVAAGRVGTMVQKHGVHGAFFGCSCYPECRYTEGSTATAAQPVAQPAPAANGAPVPSLDSIIADIARHAANGAVNEERVNAIFDARTADISATLTTLATETVAVLQAKLADVDKQLQDALAGAPRPVAITVGNMPAVTLSGAMHKALPRVLALAQAGFSNILLVGPAGAGKTFLGEQAAETLGRTFATLSCAPGQPESALIGRMVPNLTTGAENYRSTPFVDCYRNGGVFLLDEVDNADASTLLILNSALANGHLTLPSGERVTRHATFLLICSANTYGHGQSRQYVGRTQLDAAFLDRFVGATLTLDYDPDLEAQLCPEKDIRAAVQGIRTKMRELGTVRRIISTRAVLAARKLVTAVGDSIPAALLAITEGWTDEDRRAVGITC